MLAQSQPTDAGKFLEDAQIKVSVVVSEIFGVSCREMMAAPIAGERDPQVLAQMARGRMRSKTTRLVEAFIGRFSDHHVFLLTTMLARIDALNTDIDAVQERTEEELALSRRRWPARMKSLGSEPPQPR